MTPYERITRGPLKVTLEKMARRADGITRNQMLNIIYALLAVVISLLIATIYSLFR